MEEFAEQLKQAGFAGEIDDSEAARALYSHDASMFEIIPKLVVCPTNAKDVGTLVALVAKNKKNLPDLSITARSAGTDMSGAAINDSIIVDFNKHFNKIESVTASTARTQPGVFYRDFELETLKKKALLPPYPAS